MTDSQPGSDRFANLSPIKRAFLALEETQARLETLQRAQNEPIAIIGIGCRFPGGASSPAAFWQLLRNGEDATSEVPTSRWDVDALYDPDPDLPGKYYTRRGGFLREAVDTFDPLFFGISPREAESIDPQQRLLLEVAWEALENAGQPADALVNSLTGVFVGMMTHDYASMQAKVNDPAAIDLYTGTGSGLSFAAGRLSYLLGLQGPSLVVDTACSSSLVALHLACQSLRAKECNLALAGGVNLILEPDTTLYMCRLHALSPDGRCKTFDASADGYARGEGCGVVALKRLSDAQAAGDPILAVIRGSAVNHDGPSGGLTVPNGVAQQAVIRKALSSARVEPGQVGYIEAHGTGTSLGDPIEMGALNAILGAGHSAENPLFVGSVKTNFGHLESAAGIAGVIKVVLALHHGEIPPHLHFHNPNPYIPWNEIPIAIPTHPLAWSANRTAGVSSFGLSGINAHVIVQEAPAASTQPDQTDPQSAAKPYWLLPLSARSETALRSLAGAYHRWLSEHPQVDLADVCATASLRRSHHAHRLSLVCAGSDELLQYLDAAAQGQTQPGMFTAIAQPNQRRMVWVFPGQGSQWLGMGRELLACEPVFRASIEACAAAFQPHVSWSLLAELQASEEQSHLNQIDVIQPTLFAIQVSLAALWRSWGLEPAAVVGHSMGEVAAAHVAGALSLEQAAQIICQRSRLLRRVSGQGAMAVVERSFEQAQQALRGYEDRLAVAVNNGPRSTVLSGDPLALQAVAEKLKQDGVDVRYVKVDVASHSPQMDGLLGDLAVVLAGLTPRAGQVAFYSTVANQVCSGDELGADYWVRNLRSPVLFGPAVEQLAKDGHDVFIEISPHPILLPAIDENLRRAGKDALTFPSLRRGEAELRRMYESLGGLYTQGILPRWAALYPQANQMLPLPNYPWQRERYWRERVTLTQPAERRLSSAHPLLGEHWDASSHAGSHYWEMSWDGRVLPYLRDHRVGGAAVMPAAAYIEMALEAVQQVWDGASCQLCEVSFERGLGLSDERVIPIQVVLENAPSNQAAFVISSRASESGWITHARGVAQRQGSGSEGAPRFSLPELQARCQTAVTQEAHYQQASRNGLDYGPAFQGVESIWCASGEALAKVCLPGVLKGQVAGYQLHPALLDAAFQLAGHCLGLGDAGLHVPVSVETVRVYAPLPARCWGYARQQQHKPLCSDIYLLDEQGQVIVEVCGLQVQALAQKNEQAAWRDWLYQVAWRPQSFEPPAGALSAGSWLVFSNGDEQSQAILAGLQRNGQRCVVPPPLEGDWKSFLKQAFADQPCQGILYLAALTATVEPAATLQLSTRLLALLQAIYQLGWRDHPHLWLVTSHAQAVTGREQIAPAQSSLWGLGRAIAHEHPELNCTQIDLDHQPIQETVENLLAEMAWGLSQPALVEDQVAWRAGQRYVARLARHAPISQVTGLAPARERPFQLEMTEPGQLDRLTWRAARRTPPAPGQVEIEVAAASLNFLDVLKAMGVYPGQEAGAAVLGGECAGRVVGVGEGVSGLAVGDEVVALAQTGMGRYAIADANLVAHKPDALSFAQAAALPIVYMTAHYALRHVARLSPGERVLIHSAAGGTGLAAVHIARSLQAEIYATAGSPEKHAYLHELGITHVADSRSLAFADQVKTWTEQQGVDVVLNSLSGPAIPASLGALAPYGRFVEIGKKDIYDQQTLSLSPFRRSLSYTAVDLTGMAAIKPAAFARLFQEVIAAVDSGAYPPLPVRLYPASQVIEAFHHLAQGQNIGKVVVMLEDAADVPVAPERWDGQCDADATYLITGGLGGLGLKTAEWLVAKGARHLVLAGRHTPGMAANAAIEALRQKGVGVEAVAADVSQAEDVEALFALIQRTGRVLKGVIHSAGLLDDGILLKQNAERFAGVFAPKVSGGWLLHQATRACPLDFFVLYSSAASLLGAPGQGNYAAANAFLDGLAWYRQANGLPAISINWGPWGEVGLAAAQANRGERLAQQGMESIAPADGLAVLEYLMQQDVAQVGVLPIHIRQWRQSNPKAAQVALLRELVEAAGQSGPAQQDGLVAALRSLPSEQGRERLEEHLRQQLGQVLRLPAERIGSQTPVQALGLDSLMALEFRNRLENSLGLSLPVTLIWGYPTLAALSAHLASKLDLPQETAPIQAPEQAPNVQPQFSPEEHSKVSEKLAAIKKALKASP
jgi:acyl transferase domain-containing protein/nucleoside-diphosphate-sugar epimerase/acyl carrier protein